MHISVKKYSFDEWEREIEREREREMLKKLLANIWYPVVVQIDLILYKHEYAMNECKLSYE